MTGQAKTLEDSLFIPIMLELLHLIESILLKELLLPKELEYPALEVLEILIKMEIKNFMLLGTILGRFILIKEVLQTCSVN